MSLIRWDPFRDIRWDPFREMNELSQRLNRLFGTAAKPPMEEEGLTVATWWPAVDVKETAEEYQVKAELPGLKKDEIRVTLEDGNLTIQGERKQEREEKGEKFHRIERSYGSFSRTFDLPPNVESGKVMAEFKDGVLQVRIPKTAASKPKAVEVKLA